MSTVLIWRDLWLPPSETFIVNQVDALARWTPKLAGMSRIESDLIERRIVHTVARTRRAPVARRLMTRPRWVPKVHQLMSGVDLVHAHFGTDATTVMDAADAFGKPRVITFHGYDITTRLEMRRHWPMTQRWDQLVNNAAMLIAVSQHVANRLIEAGAPEERVRVIYVGIPVSVPVALAPSQRRPSILFVGRLVEKKGADLLLDALTRLPASLRSVEVTIIGDGPLRERLETQANASGLSVRFEGAQPQRRVREAMASHSLFVAPSRVAASGDAEGMGLVFLEAAAAGLPVITTPSGGNVEAVLHGSTGLITRPDDPSSLADAIVDLLEQPTLADALGAAGRARVSSSFDIRVQTRLLENVWDEVVTA